MKTYLLAIQWKCGIVDSGGEQQYSDEQGPPQQSQSDLRIGREQLCLCTSHVSFARHSFLIQISASSRVNPHIRGRVSVCCGVQSLHTHVRISAYAQKRWERKFYLGERSV